jgi:hypothetical protein
MQQAGPGNKNILIICGDENGTTMLCTSIDDVTLKNRLEVNMGHHVKMMLAGTFLKSCQFRHERPRSQATCLSVCS